MADLKYSHTTVCQVESVVAAFLVAQGGSWFPNSREKVIGWIGIVDSGAAGV
jgi:hypothetical protein